MPKKKDKNKAKAVFKPDTPLPTWNLYEKMFYVQQLKKYEYFQTKPYISCQSNDELLQQMMEIIKKLEQENDDFCWSMDWDPLFLSQLIYHGFLTIATKIQDGFYVLLPKLHTKRCIVDLNYDNIVRLVKDAGKSKSLRKMCGKYRLSINTGFKQVFQGCLDKHGESWLYPWMQNILNEMHSNNSNNKYNKVKVISVELWDIKDGTLVAGELGTIIGTIYTSLSGFYYKSGTGNVQMLGLQQYLIMMGFKMWDLGMFIEYKKEFGGIEIERKKFLSIYNKYRDIDNIIDLKKLHAINSDNSINTVRDILNLNRMKYSNNNQIISNDVDNKERMDQDMKEDNNNNNNNNNNGNKISKKHAKRLKRMERRKQAKLRNKNDMKNNENNGNNINKNDNNDIKND